MVGEQGGRDRPLLSSLSQRTLDHLLPVEGCFSRMGTLGQLISLQWGHLVAAALKTRPDYGSSKQDSLVYSIYKSAARKALGRDGNTAWHNWVVGGVYPGWADPAS